MGSLGVWRLCGNFAGGSDVARRRYGRRGSGIVFQQPVEISASFFT